MVTPHTKLCDCLPSLYSVIYFISISDVVATKNAFVGRLKLIDHEQIGCMYEEGGGHTVCTPFHLKPVSNGVGTVI